MGNQIVIEKSPKLEMLNESKVLFSLRNVYLTTGAREALEESNQRATDFLARHQSGDWGDVCEDERRENELSLKEGYRILSSYKSNSFILQNVKRYKNMADN
jgi:hypothetical protein